MSIFGIEKILHLLKEKFCCIMQYPMNSLLHIFNYIELKRIPKTMITINMTVQYKTISGNNHAPLLEKYTIMELNLN